MQRLINFSVETDNVVWLQFHNGQEQRVPVGNLAQHLLEPDLRRVRAALKLRRDFIKTHAPKAGLLLVAALGLAALWLTSNRAVAQLFAPAPTPSTVPLHENIAVFAPSPSVVVTPAPAVAVRRATARVTATTNAVHVAVSSAHGLADTPGNSVATTLRALQAASQTLTGIANTLQAATDAPVTIPPTPAPDPAPSVMPTPEVQPPADGSLATPAPTPQPNTDTTQQQ